MNGHTCTRWRARAPRLANDDQAKAKIAGVDDAEQHVGTAERHRHDVAQALARRARRARRGTWSPARPARCRPSRASNTVGRNSTEKTAYGYSSGEVGVSRSICEPALVGARLRSVEKLADSLGVGDRRFLGLRQVLVDGCARSTNAIAGR